MPTYVYGCDTCGHRFEIFQKFQDAPLTECPQCGARIRRIFQPAGIVFKGSGWYSKDSRANGKAGTANGSGESAEVKTDGAAKSDDSAKPRTDGAAKDTTAVTTAAKDT
jgi:putative FmdB family regulatory protein